MQNYLCLICSQEGFDSRANGLYVDARPGNCSRCNNGTASRTLTICPPCSNNSGSPMKRCAICGGQYPVEVMRVFGTQTAALPASV